MLRILCRPFAVTLAALLVASNTASAQETTKYTVVIAGNNAGFQTTTTAADGTREYAYEFNDRGRGPKLTSIIRLDAAGIPVSIDTTGNDYLKGCFSSVLDLSIARNIRLGGGRMLQLRADMFNAPNAAGITGRNTTLNLSNPNDPVTALNLPYDANGNILPNRVRPNQAGFGAVTTYQTARNIQGYIRFSF